MRRLGKVLHATKRGLVLRAERVSNPGTVVYAEKRKSVGQVSDVFGPVSRPYLIVKPVPEVKNLPAFVGKELFTSVVKNAEKRKRAKMSSV